MTREGFLEIKYGTSKITLYELADHTWEFQIVGDPDPDSGWTRNIGNGKGQTPGECLDKAIAIIWIRVC